MTYTCVPAIPDVPQGRCVVGMSETQGAVLSLGSQPELTAITATVFLGFIIGFLPIRAVTLVVRAVVSLVRG